MRTFDCLWADGVARLSIMAAPSDVPPRRWSQFVADCHAFIATEWAALASAHGWTALDLFGCDQTAPYARVGRLGLLWFLNGQRLASLTADCAVIVTGTGARLTYRRRPPEQGRVLAWELCAHPSGAP